MTNRFGTREVCNVVLKDINTGRPVLYLESLKVSTLQSTVQTVYAKGGRGNSKLIGWDSDREATYNMEDALITPEALAMIAGAEVKTGTKKAHKKEVLTVALDGSENVVTLAAAPKAGEKMFVFMTTTGSDIGKEFEKDKTVAAEKYVLTGNKLSFDKTEVKPGDKILVDYYYETSAATKSITISSDKFPSYYTLEAETLWRRETDGKDVPALFTIPKIKFKGDITITMGSSGEPQAFKFDANVFKDSNSTDMVIIDVLED